MNVLIIEDENLLAKELKRTLNRIAPEFNVIGQISSIEEGMIWFAQGNTADLILSDIQLTDGTSFELFKKIQTNIPIIFTTAYDDYAVKAFKLNSIDYLMKPIDEQELEHSLNRFKERVVASPKPTVDIATLNSLIAGNLEKSYKSQFVIKVVHQYKRVGIEEIGYFNADGNTVYLVTKANRKLVMDESLEKIESQIDPKLFFRINRHLLVHNNSILAIHKYFNSRLKLEVHPTPEQDALVTRSRVTNFLQWLNN
jgi:DNA-binding LytR/AlgR family response regulator